MHGSAEGGDPSELELLVRLRLGDPDAACLLAARHQGVTGVLPGRSDDLAMRATLDWAEGSAVPELPFRAALLAHHVHGRLPEWPHADPLWTAYLHLPPAWRLAVWHREVEGEDLAAIGRWLGLEQRDALRALTSSYATMRQRVAASHARDDLSGECQRLHDAYVHVPPHVLDRRQVDLLREHGRTCDGCLALIRDLFAVEHGLGESLATVVLGPGAAQTYLRARPRPGRLRARPARGRSRRGRGRSAIAVAASRGLDAAASSLTALGSGAAAPGARLVDPARPGGG